MSIPPPRSYPATDPRRLMQACDRVTDVLHDEFEDLDPAAAAFVLSQLLWVHHQSFNIAADRQLKKGNK